LKLALRLSEECASRCAFDASEFVDSDLELALRLSAQEAAEEADMSSMVLYRGAAVEGNRLIEAAVEGNRLIEAAVEGNRLIEAAVEGNRVAAVEEAPSEAFVLYRPTLPSFVEEPFDGVMVPYARGAAPGRSSLAAPGRGSLAGPSTAPPERPRGALEERPRGALEERPRGALSERGALTVRAPTVSSALKRKAPEDGCSARALGRNKIVRGEGEDWNEFRKKVKKMGLSSEEIREAYKAQKSAPYTLLNFTGFRFE
jgi:hypothetical protein